MKIKLLDENAIVPTQGSDSAAGYDLYSIENVDIRKNCRAKIRTGIALEMEQGTAGLIWPRSKLANVYGVQVLAGVVDCDYRGEIMISILNTGQETVEIRKGDRVAQILFQLVLNGYKFEVVDQLDETDRGNAGINDTELRR